MGGEQFDFHCHSNLTRAVLPHGLTELDVHDVLNVFQVTGLDENAKYFMETSPAKPGEYFEFFAEVDVLCALSACPGGLSISAVALIYPLTCTNCCFNRRSFELGLGSKGGCYGCYHAPSGSGNLYDHREQSFGGMERAREPEVYWVAWTENASTRRRWIRLGWTLKGEETLASSEEPVDSDCILLSFARGTPQFLVEVCCS